MMSQKTRILLVEDDRSIVRLLELELEHRGFETVSACDGPSGLAAARDSSPDAIVLDIMLPGLDGVGVLRELRREGDRTPVIMLTARDETRDKVHGLDSGADDYLTKPFEVEELLARLRSAIRRSGKEERIRASDLAIDTASREVRRGDRTIDLTAREYDLLEFLARNHRRVLSREVLLSRVWEQGSGVATNVVDVYVGYLRKKVDGPGETPLIHTVRGVGYVLKAPKE